MDLSKWSGLLNWSASFVDDTKSAETPKPLSEEDRAFLNKVFDSLTVDEVKRVKTLIMILKMNDDAAVLKQQLSEGNTEFVSERLRLSAQLIFPVLGVCSLIALQCLDDINLRKDRLTPEQTAELQSKISEQLQSMSVNELHEFMLEKKVRALDEIDDRVLVIDNAIDFRTVGGFPPLFDCIRSSHPEIASRACQGLFRFFFMSHRNSPILYSAKHRVLQQ